ncbi:protein kinase [Sorangium cellulosum]|uniref:non-specific serine/threonine protein kinase n=1 Tax=Sorangium cellulosum TaxID=56 RepID=A0A150U0K7_SORCE|nr:protein kinase [Sorangium cellulosum]
MPQSFKDDTIHDTPLPASGARAGAEPANAAAETGPRQVLAGRYELLGLVGIGGMGSVYRARDLELEEVVAVKVLRRELSGSPEVIDRFRREVRLSRKVTHPNVARVFDIGEHEGDRFLTMEFIDGEALAALLARERRLAVARAMDIVESVCAGLVAAHRAGVIHRDLKPDNVLLGRDGRVVLTDFGIARAIVPDGEAGKTLGAVMGTPAYMAPEQVQGAADIDARADVYALGAMLYEMLTGERAWQGDAPLAVAAARLVSDPPDPRRRRADLPDALARVVLRCMARSRDERYASVEGAAQELASLTRPATIVPPAFTPPHERTAISGVSGVISGPISSSNDPGGKSVAVLPFANQGAPSDAYLAEELTDDLIDTLSMTRGLRVRSRGSLPRRPDGEVDLRELGRELGVQVVVGGSVRRRDGTVRISARLVCVADGFQLWAKRFDRPEAEVLRINDEVAEAVAAALTLDAAAPSRTAPSDPVALDLFLRGRHEYRRYWPEHQARAIELFEQALARAPEDPMILSAYALARSRFWFFTDQGGDLAMQAAARAAAAAPGLPDARLAMASVRFQRLDVVGAMRELKAALASQSGNAEAEGLIGTILIECGAFEEGARRARSALARDPEVVLAAYALARAYALQDRWSDGEDVIRALPNSGSGSGHSVYRIRKAMWQRDPEVLAALSRRRVRDAFPCAPDPFVPLIEDVLSDRLSDDRPTLAPGPSAPVTALRRTSFLRQLQAELAAFLGKSELALHALELSLADGLFDLVWMERCPVLASLRADPRYAAIQAEVERRASAVIAVYRER